MPLVAGVDSSTQACKVVVRDADTGAWSATAAPRIPDGTEVDPAAWEVALHEAVGRAGGLDDVAALSVAAQQHGMVCLDDSGQVVRPALLWNDTRSATAAADLVAELGGGQAWADAVGSVPVASFTVTKLRWLAEHEPESARRTAAVCLPHDWLTWRLAGSPGPGLLVHRSRRRERNRLLVGEPRELPPRPADPRSSVGTPSCRGCWARPIEPACVPAATPSSGREPATTPAPRSVSARSRRRDRLDRYVGSCCRRRGQRHHRRLGHRCRVRRRHREVPPARLHAQRGPGARCRGPAARRRPRPAVAARPRRRRPARAGWCSSPTSRVSGRRTGPRPPDRCTA